MIEFMHRNRLTMDGIERADRTQRLWLQFFVAGAASHSSMSAAHRAAATPFSQATGPRLQRIAHTS